MRGASLALLYSSEQHLYARPDLNSRPPFEWGYRPQGLFGAGPRFLKARNQQSDELKRGRRRAPSRCSCPPQPCLPSSSPSTVQTPGPAVVAAAAAAAVVSLSPARPPPLARLANTSTRSPPARARPTSSFPAGISPRRPPPTFCPALPPLLPSRSAPAEPALRLMDPELYESVLADARENWADQLHLVDWLAETLLQWPLVRRPARLPLPPSFRGSRG